MYISLVADRSTDVCFDLRRSSVYLVDEPGTHSTELATDSADDGGEEAMYFKLSVRLSIPSAALLTRHEYFVQILKDAIDQVIRGQRDQHTAEKYAAGKDGSATDGCRVEILSDSAPKAGGSADGSRGHQGSKRWGDDESGGYISRASWFTFTLKVVPDLTENDGAHINSSSFTSKLESMKHRLQRDTINRALEKLPGNLFLSVSRGTVLDVRSHLVGPRGASVAEVIPLMSISLPVERKPRARDRLGGQHMRAGMAAVRQLKAWIGGERLLPPRHLHLSFALTKHLEIRDEGQLEWIMGVFRRALLETAMVGCAGMTATEARRAYQMEQCLDALTLSVAQVEEFQGPETAWEGQWDMFLSYRVDADVDVAERLFFRLSNMRNPATGRNWRVFFDKKSLTTGRSWEESFVEALCSCKVVVPIVSSRTFARVGQLKKESKVDNVMLEWDLALELAQLGRVRAVHPIFVGDDCELRPQGAPQDKSTGPNSPASTIGPRPWEIVYGDYLKSWSCRQDPDVVVEEARKKAVAYLNNHVFHAGVWKMMM